MSYLDLLFNNKKPNQAELLAFGFTKNNTQYSYSEPIADNQFLLTVTVDAVGLVSATVIDIAASEEYVLHLMPRAEGTFVGAIRTAYEHLLREISHKCFEVDVFKSDYAQIVIRHVRAVYGGELEFLWPRTPTGAIYRRKDTDKWYALMMIVPKSKLGLESNELVEVLNLKMKPENVNALIDGHKYHQAYHMNKKHWLSICLDGSAPIDEVLQKIATSYHLAGK